MYVCDSSHWFSIPDIERYHMLVTLTAPGAPTTPRLYIMPHKSTASAALQTMAVDLRWSAPEATNGVLVRHVITHWINHERRQVIEVAGTAHRYVLAPLEIETTYHFQVSARFSPYFLPI